MQNGSPSTPKFRSISRRFSYALIGVVTLMLAGFAAFAIFFNVSKIEGELERKLNTSLRLAEISLPKPLWNVEYDYIRDFVKSLFLDKSIVYARVLWGNLVITEEKRDRFQEKDFAYFESTGKFIAKTSSIMYQGQKVGTIQLVMSREIVRNELILNISVIINLTLFIIIGISATSIFITRRYISRPLMKLQQSAALLAQGDLEAPIETGSSDEIGRLAEDLSVMRDSIKHLFGELSESKEKLEGYSRTLEEKVEVRTLELARSVEELQALGEVSQAVSSTLDLQKVLATIVAHAVELSETESGAIYEFDEANEQFELRATHRMSDELTRAIREGRINLGETAVGRAGEKRQAVQVPDIREEPNYPLRERAELPAPRDHRAGWIPSIAGGSPASREQAHWWFGSSTQGAWAVCPGNGGPPAEFCYPVGPGNPECQAFPGNREKGTRAGDRQQAQVRVPRQHEPRTENTPERHPGLYGTNTGQDIWQCARRDSRGPGAGGEKWASSLELDQRRPGHFQDRGGSA